MESNPNFLQRLAALDPAILRGTILAIVGLVAVVTGSAIDNSTVELIINAAVALLALVAALVIRPAVTPNAKVIAFKPNPIDAPSWVAAGEATITPELEEAVVAAAHSSPKAA